MSRCHWLSLAAFNFLLFTFQVPSVALAVNDMDRTSDILGFALAASVVGTTAVNRDGQGILQYSKTVALSSGLTYALKHTVDEDRPNGGDHAFPSMHSSFSFATGEFMRKRYGWKYGLPAYITATFVGYCRVEADEHYWHDVIAGGAIGIASGYLFADTYNGLMVSAGGGKNHIGFMLTRSW